MMAITTVLLVTVDRLRCWFTAGHDDARLGGLSKASEWLRSNCHPAIPDTARPPIAAIALDLSESADITGNLRHG